MLFFCLKSHGCLISIWSLVFSPLFSHSYANKLGEHEALHALFPSLFFSSYSLGTVLVEHDALFPLFILFYSLRTNSIHWAWGSLCFNSLFLIFYSNSLANALGELEAPHTLFFIFFFSFIVLFYQSWKKNPKNPKNKQKNKPPINTTKAKSLNTREHWKLNCLAHSSIKNGYFWSLFNAKFRS